MIVYLDTETTGLTPGKICQLSYVMQSKYSVTAKNLFFAVDYVEPSAQAVHGFSVEKLKTLSGSKIFSDYADEIFNDLCLSDLIVTHNFVFDYSFLRKEFENIGKTFIYKESFCSMKKTTPVCKLQRSSGVGYKYPKLSEACKFFSVTDTDIALESKKLFGESADYHDARFDATAVYLLMTKGVLNLPEFKILEKYL